MRVRTEAKRQEIMAAAWEIFRRDGYGRTTMATIASHLGGSKGTLYGYFPSKDELLLAVIENMFADRGEEAFEKLALDLPLPERLTLFACDYVALRIAPDTLALDRIMISEAGRTEFAKQLRDRLLFTQWKRVAAFIDEESNVGRLRVNNAERAASELRAMLTWPMLELYLFDDQVPNEDVARDHATSCVATFLRAYAP